MHSRKISGATPDITDETRGRGVRLSDATEHSTAEIIGLFSRPMMASKVQLLLEKVMIARGRHWMREARGAALGALLFMAPVASVAGEASIPFANHGGIRDWRADGSKGMWIEAASGRWYYASFSSQCTSLQSAIGVTFVPEPSGDLSRWSSIRLQHDERCFFRTLQPSNAPPKPGHIRSISDSEAGIPDAP